MTSARIWAVRKVVDPDRRDIAHAKQPGGSQSGVAGDYSLFRIDQYRAHEPKLLDAGGDPPDLLWGVGWKIGPQRFSVPRPRGGPGGQEL